MNATALVSLSNSTSVAPSAGPGDVTASGGAVSEQAPVVKLNIVPLVVPAQFDASIDQ